MKKVLTYLFAAGMMISAASLMFTSCTKEGPQGPAGANGTNGENGQDANATCTQCHNFSDMIVARIIQYDNSLHGSGLTFERNGVDCAPCHTSQGFKEFWETGSVAEDIQNPAPVGCRTCHMIHDTYTATDWELRYTSSFTNALGLTTDMTTEGGNVTGNLCARCHQSRASTPVITDPSDDVNTLIPTSSHYGPHHGPQSAMLAGTDGFETIGGANLPNSWHTGKTTCQDCHMAAAFGGQAGGHTMAMGYEYHEALVENVAGCNVSGCHDPALEDFDYDGKMTTTIELFELLAAKLDAAGVMSASGTVVTGQPRTQKMLATIYNWKMVQEDRSFGIHNYKRSKAMLENGIAYLESLGY